MIFIEKLAYIISLILALIGLVLVIKGILSLFSARQKNQASDEEDVVLLKNLDEIDQIQSESDVNFVIDQDTEESKTFYSASEELEQQEKIELEEHENELNAKKVDLLENPEPDQIKDFLINEQEEKNSVLEQEVTSLKKTLSDRDEKIKKLETKFENQSKLFQEQKADFEAELQAYKKEISEKSNTSEVSEVEKKLGSQIEVLRQKNSEYQKKYEDLQNKLENQRSNSNDNSDDALKKSILTVKQLRAENEEMTAKTQNLIKEVEDLQLNNESLSKKERQLTEKSLQDKAYILGIEKMYRDLKLKLEQEGEGL